MTKKINLLSISLDANISHQQFADAQKRQLEYAQYFNLYTIIILTTKSQGLVAKKIRNLTIIPTNSIFKPLAIWDAVKIAIKENSRAPFDLLTAQDPIATGLVAIILKHIFKKPLNIQLHTEYTLSQEWLSLNFRNRLLPPLISWEIHQVDSLRVDNQSKIKKLRRRYPNLKAKIFSAPMRVDLNYFYQPVKKRQVISKFISVGRLSPEKNFSLLLKAFKRVVDNYPQAHLTIIGGGSEKLIIRRLIKKLKLIKHVSLAGSQSREKIRHLLWQADVFVLSSNYEGWGLVFVEAFAAGLPVITTKVASTGELVINNKNSFVVPIGNYQQLAHKMIQLIKNPQTAYQFAKFGQKLIQEKYQPQQLVSHWIKGLYATAKT